MGFERCELRRRHLSSRNDSRWHGNRLPIDGVTGPNRACSCNLSVGAGSASKQPLQGQLPWWNPSELTGHAVLSSRNEWIASFKNQHFILYAYSVVSLQQFGKEDSRLPRAFLSAARAAFEPAEAELLSCAWRQPRSNRNQKSSQSSQIKALMQDWNELADEKGNFELQGTCGQARCEPELKLGALSNANLLPDPGSKILPTSWKPSKTVRSRPSFSAGSSLQALTDELA